MYNKLITFFLCATIFSACTQQQREVVLFDGSSLGKWNVSENVSLIDGVAIIEGPSAVMSLKKGSYADFELNATVRTIGGGKGFVAFHTDNNGNGGYKVAIDNDIDAEQWWTKSGSLLDVRNIVKSVANDNEWFDMNIRVEGKKVSVAINGELVTEYIEPTKPFRLPENANQLLSKGSLRIASIGTSGSIEIEKIKLTPLDSNVDIAAQQAEAIDETTDGIIKLHQQNFPVLDYHVHLKDDLTLELAKEQSRRYGINYALSPNCGIGFPITTDQQVVDYLKSMSGQPFVQAMQGEGREWPETFSKEVRDQFDFVFTDAMTFTDTKGRRTRLWIADEVWVEDEQKYMDLIVDKICTVLREPIDVYVNPTFLPDVMMPRYDELWTNERQQRVIDALVETGRAVEISHRFEIPNQSFIEKAKAAGLKFTFGTNNINSDFGKLEYCIMLKEKCGLTAADMYNPFKKTYK